MALGSKFERVDFQTFAPDLRPDEPSLLLDSNFVYPTVKGFRALPAPVEVLPALATGFCYGAYFARYLDGTSRVFAGTNTKLYEADVTAGSWDDVSRTVGGDYNVASRHRWRFTQFGNDTIAVNGNDAPQFINEAGTDFAALAGSPPNGRYITTANNFVFMANLEPGGGVDENYWWCSGIGNDADWTPNVATQSANGFVKDTPGPITGCKSIGRNIVVYKERAMYLFEYVGPPVIWSNQILSQQAGAWGNECVVDIGGTHVFMGFDDFYIYDGSGPPQSLKNPLREFLFERGDLDKQHAYAVIGRWDRELGCVFWHYPSINAPAQDDDEVILDRYVVWNVGTDRWAIGSLDVAAVVLPEYGSQPGITYDDFGTYFTTWATADDVSWTSSLFAGGPSVVQAFFDPTDDKLYSLTGGVHADTYVRGGYWGDGIHERLVRRYYPIMSRYPSAASGTRCKVFTKNILGGAEREADDQLLNLTNGTFDVQADARYHSPKFEFGDDIEIIGYNVEFEEETGER